MNQGWHGLAFAPLGSQLMFVSENGTAEIWDVENDKRVSQLGSPGFFNAPHIALSPDGTLLAGLADSGVVAIWNKATREHLYSFRSERSAVWSLAWSSGGRQLAVGLSNGGLAVWNLPAVESELDKLGLHLLSDALEH